MSKSRTHETTLSQNRLTSDLDLALCPCGHCRLCDLHASSVKVDAQSDEFINTLYFYIFDSHNLSSL